MTILKFIGIGVASFYILWILYLAVMNLKRARDASTLSKPALIMAYPLVIVGYIWDVLWNWVFLTVVLLELPTQGVVTSRLHDHYKKDTWRGHICTWICDNLLNAFDTDPRGHCRQKQGE